MFRAMKSRGVRGTAVSILILPRINYRILRKFLSASAEAWMWVRI